MKNYDISIGSLSETVVFVISKSLHIKELRHVIIFSSTFWQMILFMVII